MQNFQQKFFGNLEGYELSFENSLVHIVSEKGCTVVKLILNGQDILDCYKTEEELMQNNAYKNVLLLPFPNRINHGSYEHDGQRYQLPINEPARGHALHGIVYNKPFQLTGNQTNDHATTATFSFRAARDELSGYPFAFGTQVTFTLSKTSLQITVTTTNNDTTSLPYGIGWHPYLTLHKKIDDVQMSLPACEFLEASKTLIPTGTIQAITPTQEKLDDKTFDTCFTHLTLQQITLDNITLFQDQSMNFLQIYTPHERDSIAIEPMSCAPDAFNNHMGLLVLSPNETMTHTFGIRTQ